MGNGGGGRGGHPSAGGQLGKQEGEGGRTVGGEHRHTS